MPDVLLVIDVQQALIEELAPGRGAELLGTLEPLLGRARSAGMPVVYVRHDGSPHELIPGTPAWEIARALTPLPGEPIVDKRFGDAFKDTNLAEVLSRLDADTLIVTGMQTDQCVRATVEGATGRGYRVTLVEDAHATSPSSGKSEAEIREAVHSEALSRGARLLPAAGLFGTAEHERGRGEIFDRHS